MEEQGWLASEWGDSETNRKAKYYRLTKSGRRQLGMEVKRWDQVALAMARVLEAE